MASHLRMPALVLAIISITLGLAIVGCAGQTLRVFNSQQATNTWFLPVWPNHFDTSELRALIGTSAAIVVLNAVLAAALFLKSLPSNLIVFLCAVLSTICAIVAIAFPAVITTHAPTRDTLQTWTCRWSSASINHGSGPPANFATICRETRFAFYASIPLFLLQLALLTLAVLAILSGARRQDATRFHDEPEKGLGQHELDSVRQSSIDAKSESSRSVRSGAKLAGFA